MNEANDPGPEGPEDRGPTCGVCRHYVRVDDTQGQCWFNPPMPFPVATQGNVQLPGQQTAQGFAVMQIRPPVSVNEYACGRFDPSEDDQSDGSPGDR